MAVAADAGAEPGAVLLLQSSTPPLRAKLQDPATDAGRFGAQGLHSLAPRKQELRLISQHQPAALT